MSEQSQQAPPRRLTRSTTDRMLGGVCGGLAELTGIDPVVFRVVVAVAALMGGTGFIAYLIAWAIIPSADDETSHAESLLHDHRVPRIGLVGIGILALLIVGTFDGWGPGRRWGHGGFGLVVLVGLGIWLWLRNDRPALPSPPAAPAPPVPPRPLVAEDDTITAPVPPVPPAPPAPRYQRRRRRERSALPLLTFSVLLIAGGILAAVQAAGRTEVAADKALAILLIIVGAGLVVGSVLGRANGLFFLGLLLTFATAVAAVADVPFEGGAGDRRWAPVDGSAREYHLGMGDATLDLRGFDPRVDGSSIEATVGMGHLLVELPPDVDVRVEARVGFGNITMPGIDDAGVDVDRTRTFDSDGAGRLVLDLEVGMGQVEVVR